jgi:hypothetical protein
MFARQGSEVLSTTYWFRRVILQLVIISPMPVPVGFALSAGEVDPSQAEGKSELRMCRSRVAVLFSEQNAITLALQKCKPP